MKWGQCWKGLEPPLDPLCILNRLLWVFNFWIPSENLIWKAIISKLMSTNSHQMKFPPSQLLKITMLVLCSPFLSPDSPLRRFICSPLLLPAAPISLTPPLLCLLPVRCTSAFPLLYSALLLCSHLSSWLPHFIFSSVRFVLWLQRLNSLTKHTKLHTCKCTQGKKTLCTFLPSPGPLMESGLHSVCQNWSESCVCTFAINLCMSFFEMLSLRLTLSSNFTGSQDFIST